MKLFYSPTSPFVRKVVATAIETGADERIERVTTNPWESPPALLAQNPLAKVPCLVLDDGLALIDSKLICEYLSDLAGGALLPSGPARWAVLRREMIADGVMDAAVIRRNEGTRPEEKERAANMARQAAIMVQGLAALEADPPSETLDLGGIAVACALGYLDLRFAHEPWRDSHPKLAAWLASVSARPSLSKSAPA